MQDNHILTELFGDSIYSYDRAVDIENWKLVDVSEIAREAGFQCPVAMTSAAWIDCVAWSEDDDNHRCYERGSDRLWDTLCGAFHTMNINSDHSHIEFQINCIPRYGKSIKARLTTLKLVTELYDTGEQVVTIMLPQEDLT